MTIFSDAQRLITRVVDNPVRDIERAYHKLVWDRISPDLAFERIDARLDAAMKRDVVKAVQVADRAAARSERTSKLRQRFVEAVLQNIDSAYEKTGDAQWALDVSLRAAELADPRHPRYSYKPWNLDKAGANDPRSKLRQGGVESVLKYAGIVAAKDPVSAIRAIGDAAESATPGSTLQQLAVKCILELVPSALDRNAIAAWQEASLAQRLADAGSALSVQAKNIMKQFDEPAINVQLRGYDKIGHNRALSAKTKKDSEDDDRRRRRRDNEASSLSSTNPFWGPPG